MLVIRIHALTRGNSTAHCVKYRHKFPYNSFEEIKCSYLILFDEVYIYMSIFEEQVVYKKENIRSNNT